MMSNGRRKNVPPWIMNSELVAPCMCGRLFDPTMPYTIQDDEDTGLRRWWHIPCLYYWTYQDDIPPTEDQDPLL